MRITRVPTIVVFVILLLSGCSKSYKNAVSYNSIGYSQQKHELENFTSDEEGAVQEPAWTYFERLSYLFGADSTCVGMHDDMNFPEWYSGCFVNDMNRLTINVVGDTSEIRTVLARQLGGNEFDLGIGVCSIKEQIMTKQLLRDAIAQKFNGDFTSETKPDGTIEICLQGNSDSIISNFKRDIFDAPILRFTLADTFGLIAMSNPECYDNQKDDYDERDRKRYPAFQFDNGDDYIVDGMYRIVDEQGRIGYANEKGNTVITPRFKFAFPFENGKARVTDVGIKIQDGEHWYWDSSEWYFIDKTGRKID